jgi:hypothetical protein
MDEGYMPDFSYWRRGAAIGPILALALLAAAATTASAQSTAPETTAPTAPETPAPVPPEPVPPEEPEEAPAEEEPAAEAPAPEETAPEAGGPEASAPLTTDKQIGPVVSVMANGGEVRAFGARVSVDGAAARVKAAGAVVEVRGAVEGPIWAAGADVSVDAQSGDSVRVAGARVVVRGRAASELMAAGALVDIDATVGSNLRAAGANVQIGPLTTVGGQLSAAGASVVVDGQVTGDVELAGAVVTFNGKANGRVRVHAERLIVGPQAVIGGGLLVRSLSEPQIDPAASITGEVVRETPGEWFDDVPEASTPVVAGVFAAAIILTGIVFLLFARNTYGEAIDNMRFRPLSSALFGIVTKLIVVVLAVLLMATGIGFPLGIALLLVLPIVCVLGVAVAAAGIVGWIFGRDMPWLGVGRLLAFLIIGALVIAFAGIIPVTGAWIVLAALIFGVGALLRALLWRFRTARAEVEAVG